MIFKSKVYGDEFRKGKKGKSVGAKTGRRRLRRSTKEGFQEGHVFVVKILSENEIRW